MGRGAYDTSNASSAKSSAAHYAINAFQQGQGQADRDAEIKAAIKNEQKFIKSKKSRGIITAREEAKAKAQSPSKNEPTGTKNTGGKK